MNAYEEKQEARRERLETRTAKLRSTGQARIDKAHDMASIIPFGQPILIGHHSERGDRAYRGRIHDNFNKGFETLREADEVAARADSVGTGGISSDDPDALAKLKDKMTRLIAKADAQAALNKQIRAGKFDEIDHPAINVEALKRDIAKWPYRQHTYFFVSNIRAEIRRLKDRIAGLEKAATRQHVEIVKGGGIKIVQNVEANRVQIIFRDKPDAAMRAKLKHRGFRWAPSEGAWQRHLNNAGIYAAQCIMRELCE